MIIEPIPPEEAVDNVLQGLCMDVADLCDFAEAQATLPHMRDAAEEIMNQRDRLDQLLTKLVPYRMAAE